MACMDQENERREDLYRSPSLTPSRMLSPAPKQGEAKGEPREVEPDVTLGSALHCTEEILKLVDGKQPVFFLDYDGTLSPIVSDPDKAHMPEASRETVKQLSEKFTTAIVTGRGKTKVKSFVKLDNVFYAGSHGLDISGPTNSSIECTQFEAYREQFKTGGEELAKQLDGVYGAWVENNHLSLSVHYRLSDPKDVPRVEKIVDEFLQTEIGKSMRKSNGKKVFELKLATNWNKGAALLYILQALKLESNPNAIPFYIGDDITDEDAFEAIRNLGRGVSVLVSDCPGSRPTLAKYSLKNTVEVQMFLAKFVDRASVDSTSSTKL